MATGQDFVFEPLENRLELTYCWRRICFTVWGYKVCYSFPYLWPYPTCPII